MKATRLNGVALTTMALAMLAGSAVIVIAGEASSKGEVARVIQLHAPNNAAQTVTIWTATTTPRRTATIATPRNGVAKVIQLHAPNSPTPSVTVWLGSTAKSIDAAPPK